MNCRSPSRWLRRFAWLVVVAELLTCARVGDWGLAADQESRGPQPSARVGDWPQFLGPTRNAFYAGSDLAEAWPKEGPPLVWQSAAGQGFSGPAIAQGRLILFHRLGDQEVVQCLDARSGRPLWKFAYATSYRDAIVGEDHGPRATPTVVGGKVYTFGAQGKLHCLDLADGHRLWSKDLAEQFGADAGFFGFACSPLVEGKGVLLNVGGPHGAGIVALDRDSGETLWQATDDEASYSSPIAADLAGHRCALFFTRAGFVALDPASGKVASRFAWRSRQHASVNAAAPVLVGDAVFLSACYETGALLLRLGHGEPERVWSGGDSLSCHFATPVWRAGFLYGFDGRHEYGERLRCIEADSGKVRWTKEGVGAGSLILAGDRLVIWLESGQLLLAAARPDGFEELGRAQLLGAGCRALPALADGLLYVRSRDKVASFDFRRH